MRWVTVLPALGAVALGVSALGVSARPAQAECDLGRVVGYQLVLAKVIEGYIEGGKRFKGFSGCNLDRVLVFTDGTGVRCKEVDAATANLPTAYLFAKSQNDMKLCVGDAMYDVARAN
jgi:hypothetical protein